jgi:hypothetical protein
MLCVPSMAETTEQIIPVQDVTLAKARAVHRVMAAFADICSKNTPTRSVDGVAAALARDKLTH